MGILLIVSAPLVWRSGPEKWERAKLLYWQWRCMHYSPAADEIVYDQVPAGRSPLLDAGRDYTPQVPWLAGPTTTAAGKFPKCADRFAKLSIGSGYMGTPPILFMHERISPSGKKFLIVVEGDLLGSDKSVGQLFVDTEVFQPGDWTNFPEPADGTWSIGGRLPAPGFARWLRIYAGQIDPNDSSHFTVRYEDDGRTKFIDGYVDDISAEAGLKMAGVDYAKVKLVDRGSR